MAETAGDRGTSLRRGIAILRTLEREAAANGAGLGVTQIANAIGREKSQVSRTLKILREEELVERDPRTLAYRLSWRLFALAARAGDAHLVAESRPLLRATVDRLGERAHLSVLQGHDVLTLLSESPAYAVQAAGWVGQTVPVYCTASGRALLFDHDRLALETLLGDVEFQLGGPNGPRDVAELARRIHRARARGYASATDELEAGLVAVAAPVRDFRCSIVAALNVSAPKFRFGRRLVSAGEAVKEAAATLSTRLGWVDPAAAGGRPG